MPNEQHPEFIIKFLYKERACFIHEGAILIENL